MFCLTLWDPMDHSPPGSSVHGILWARILEWVAISFSRGFSQPRDQPRVSCIAGRFFTIWTTRGANVGLAEDFVQILQQRHRGKPECTFWPEQWNDVFISPSIPRSLPFSIKSEYKTGSCMWREKEHSGTPVPYCLHQSPTIDGKRESWMTRLDLNLCLIQLYCLIYIYIDLGQFLHPS